VQLIHGMLRTIDTGDFEVFFFGEAGEVHRCFSD
jgi:hypothetical protein